jgi:hypothetical protein
MKLQGPIVYISTGIAIVMLSAGFAQAARIPRIELLREVSITGTRVLLSDLLPASAPESLRTRAGQISMGAPPQPGNTRILERDAIKRQVSASEGILEEISVPGRIALNRDSRPITLTEVFEAVRSALKRSGMPAAATLQPANVLFESQIFVGLGDSGLQVMRMEFDRGLRRARFLLWPSRSPKVLPFLVTAQLEGELPLAPIRPSMDINRLAQNSIAPAAKRSAMQEILVAPGERATLTLHSHALRIFVDVVSLERGTLGQQIRVRMMDTGKVLSAQVDGRDHLEVKF